MQKPLLLKVYDSDFLGSWQKIVLGAVQCELESLELCTEKPGLSYLVRIVGIIDLLKAAAGL